MKNKKTIIVLLSITVLLSLNGFISDNPYFSITKKDVELIIPKGFPKPVCNFSKNKLSPEIFILGRKLFYDPILSADSSISCGFCHQRIAAFAHIDHTLSHGINGLIGKRNVPPLQNLIWQNTFMWDGGVNHLEVQPLAPISNPIEMNEDIKHVILKLQRNKEYSGMFKLAFGDTIVSSEKMLKALAQFTGLMISSDSKYDKFVRKEDTLSKTEMSGLKIFRVKCANCHKEPLFTDNSFRNNGLKPDSALNDSGRIKITGNINDKMKFRVPSLRNVEMTYPYMHDGRFKNLQQAVDHYSKGKFYGNFDKSLSKTVGITEKEKTELIAFLKTLTDKTFLYDRRFADPNYK